jgi:DNA-binding response OmpR family regulator
MDQLRVLLIDDEVELVTALVERLGYRGITAEYALDGYEAMAKMRGQVYDAVVLDLKLPGMEGTEVLRQIGHQYPDTPVLLITGHGSPIDPVDPKPEGAYDYLMKPIKIDLLVQRIREAVSQK